MKSWDSQNPAWGISGEFWELKTRKSSIPSFPSEFGQVSSGRDGWLLSSKGPLANFLFCGVISEVFVVFQHNQLMAIYQMCIISLYLAFYLLGFSCARIAGQNLANRNKASSTVTLLLTIFLQSCSVADNYFEICVEK